MESIPRASFYIEAKWLVLDKLMIFQIPSWILPILGVLGMVFYRSRLMAALVEAFLAVWETHVIRVCRTILRWTAAVTWHSNGLQQRLDSEPTWFGTIDLSDLELEAQITQKVFYILKWSCISYVGFAREIDYPYTARVNSICSAGCWLA